MSLFPNEYLVKAWAAADELKENAVGSITQSPNRKFFVVVKAGEITEFMEETLGIDMRKSLSDIFMKRIVDYGWADKSPRDIAERFKKGFDEMSDEKKKTVAELEIVIQENLTGETAGADVRTSVPRTRTKKPPVFETT
ncbi:MAG: hypothetical protein AAF549_05155 [Pseudomonadota bacterium]